MDMTQFDCHALTNSVLTEKFDGRYEGTICAVEKDMVWNRYLGKKVAAPIIHFADGWQWIPNVGGRRVLQAALGTESDRWVGRRVAVYLVNDVVKTDPATGAPVQTFKKLVAVLADEGTG